MIEAGTPSSADIEVILESILRGAAKILGCTSANLTLFNESTQEVSVRVGTTAGSHPALKQVEAVVGEIRKRSFSFRDADRSLVFQAWRDRCVLETSSFAELLGQAFDPEVIGRISAMIGEHRFICVPTLNGSRCYGVIVFEKPGTHPFSPQQRELLLRYARRIGEIIENDLRDRGLRIPAGGDWSVGGVVARLLVDEGGVVVGSTDGLPVESACGPETASQPPPGWMAALVARAGKFLVDRGAGPLYESLVEAPASEGDPRRRLAAEVSRIAVRGQPLALVSIYEVRPKPELAGHQLLHLALGETAPAVLVGPDYRITSCNDATERLFGYPAGDLVGRPIGILFRDPEETHTLLNHQFLFLSDGYHEEGTVLKHRDGRVFPGKVEALLLADTADQVVGFLVLIRDRSAVLDDPKDRNGLDRLMRRERLATLGEMAGQLAHEIRNPLLAVGATLESLIQDVAEGRDIRDVLETLRGEVTRMDMLLKDYLSVAARHQASLARVDLAQVIEDASRLLKTSRKSANKVITSKVPRGLTVLGDYDGLRHVFFNLILNALEAMPSGGEVQCTASVADSDVAIHVDDRGAGLACKSSECFEPFFTTKKHGTGLGLTVCQKVVAAHGGTITLKNRRGGGCRATVVLPRRTMS